jgi:hypothetical protein
VVFLNLATSAYNTIRVDPIGATIGQAFRPQMSTNVPADSEWKFFQSFGTFKVAAPATPASAAFTLTQVPVVGYRGTGEAVECKGASRGSGLSSQAQAMGLRLVEGVSTPSGELLIRSTNNFYNVETDKFGRIRVRARESYR